MKNDSSDQRTKIVSRVIEKFDMTLLHALRNRDILDTKDDANNDLIKRLQDNGRKIDRKHLGQSDLQDHTLSEDTKTYLLLIDDLEKRRPLDWELAKTLLRVSHDVKPKLNHGTHVAGTLGGRWVDRDRDGRKYFETGMCPDIKLYDFNVVGSSYRITEFAVVAAQRLIKHINESNDFMVIHGANISLSIPHNVTNYACGRTPVCEEAESLIGSGVVVVAAAGNQGYNKFLTEDGVKELHTNTSITDPGNAESVITVGSTHRRQPHTYGVSYFSSRGPTGDGRLKPDLVAPGEKIYGPVCDGEFDTLEGTSMASPYVSGAAAILLARFSEFIGAPNRVKEILCLSATDLGRERNYQGHGLVDILRALQSV